MTSRVLIPRTGADELFVGRGRDGMLMRMQGRNSAAGLVGVSQA